MPIHVDIRINDDLVQRVHIARMSRGGMQPDSINTYSVVVAEKEPVFRGDQPMKMEFPAEPTWLQWEEGQMFTHRYGDGVRVCIQKALNLLNPLDTTEQELRDELAQVKAELAEAQLKLTPTV